MKKFLSLFLMMLFISVVFACEKSNVTTDDNTSGTTTTTESVGENPSDNEIIGVVLPSDSNYQGESDCNGDCSLLSTTINKIKNLEFGININQILPENLQEGYSTQNSSPSKVSSNIRLLSTSNSVSMANDDPRLVNHNKLQNLVLGTMWIEERANYFKMQIDESLEMAAFSHYPGGPGLSIENNKFSYKTLEFIPSTESGDDGKGGTISGNTTEVISMYIIENYIENGKEVIEVKSFRKTTEYGVVKETIYEYIRKTDDRIVMSSYHINTDGLVLRYYEISPKDEIGNFSYKDLYYKDNNGNKQTKFNSVIGNNETVIELVYDKFNDSDLLKVNYFEDGNNLFSILQIEDNNLAQSNFNIKTLTGWKQIDVSYSVNSHEPIIVNKFILNDNTEDTSSSFIGHMTGDSNDLQFNIELNKLASSVQGHFIDPSYLDINEHLSVNMQYNDKASVANEINDLHNTLTLMGVQFFTDDLYENNSEQLITNQINQSIWMNSEEFFVIYNEAENYTPEPFMGLNLPFDENNVTIDNFTIVDNSLAYNITYHLGDLASSDYYKVPLHHDDEGNAIPYNELKIKPEGIVNGVPVNDLGNPYEIGGIPFGIDDEGYFIIDSEGFILDGPEGSRIPLINDSLEDGTYSLVLITQGMVTAPIVLGSAEYNKTINDELIINAYGIIDDLASFYMLYGQGKLNLTIIYEYESQNIYGGISNTSLGLNIDNESGNEQIIDADANTLTFTNTVDGLLVEYAPPAA